MGTDFTVLLSLQESTITLWTSMPLGSCSGTSAPALSSSQRPLRNVPARTSCGPMLKKVICWKNYKHVVPMLSCACVCTLTMCVHWHDACACACVQVPGQSGWPASTRSAGSWWRPAGTGTPPSAPCWASWSPACSPSWHASATVAPIRKAAALRIQAKEENKNIKIIITLLLLYEWRSVFVLYSLNERAAKLSNAEYPENYL